MSIMKDSREATMYGRRSDGSTVHRPLSPHLQVYDMYQMSSLLSILGRITGVIWSLGLLLLVWWLVAVAAGAPAYDNAVAVMGHPLGLLVLFGLSAAAWFHTLNGIRHLNWDIGRGFAVPEMYRTGWMVIIGTGVATVLTWLLALVF
jgi:succinate dehydrogenase / fumarate reductase, cytochrome b subunit